jgi:rhodanese-related sulfurtransferase
MMDKAELCLINVHIPYAGEISETDMYSMIVVYCKSGPMGKSAAEKLVELGYTNVFNLRNGMIEWQQRGNRLLFRPERRDN